MHKTIDRTALDSKLLRREPKAAPSSPSRRRLLAALGLAGAGAMLPGLLPGLMRPALADGVVAPRRVLFVYFPNGVEYSSWHAIGGETDFSLPVMTTPLEAVREHCVFLSGMEMYGSAGTHEGGQHKMLSGRSGHPNDLSATIDVFLGEQVKYQVTRPFLNLGVVGNQWNKPITFDFGGKAIPTDDNPLAVYERLFGSNAAEDALIARRRSVIDGSLAEINALQSRLGALEREKLEVHLESLRALERTLADARGGGCDTSGFNRQGFRVTRTEHLDNDNFATVAALQAELATLAMACDLSRVVTLKFSHPVSPVIIRESGSATPCHQASHQQDHNFDLIQRWHVQQFADLIARLASYPEGEGSMLDNTLLFLFSELGDSSGHNHRNMPFVLAGGAAAGVRGGRRLGFDREAHNKILVSMARFMGVAINEFGHTDANPGELPGLV